MDKKPAPPDPKRLLQMISAFIEVETWPESKRLIEQCPELLSDEADVLLEHLIAVAHEQSNPDGEHIFGEYRELLRRCRLEGVEAAFASLIQLAKLTTSSRPTPEIPLEFE